MILLGTIPPADFSGHWAGLTALVLFGAAYLAVIAEERLHLPKSHPMLLAAGGIWLLVGLAFAQAGDITTGEELAGHNLLEFAELFLFLLVAMTYVNTIGERGVFQALRAWLVARGFSLRALFWATGGLAFVLSPVADNLTTALILGAVVIALGEGRPRFVPLACINIVVAANAGGAFSPFGDITTLMVWQEGLVGFFEFLVLFVPSLVSWLVPAAIMSLQVERGRPVPVQERAAIEPGGVTVVLLFVSTIVLTVAGRNVLHLPPALGMMLGLGILKIYAYGFNRARRKPDGDGGMDGLEPALAPPTFSDLVWLGEPAAFPVAGVAAHAPAHGAEVAAVPAMARTGTRATPTAAHGGPPGAPARDEMPASGASNGAMRGQARPLDIFRQLERVEWDTLIFFYGVILCVGGLGAFGYLALTSRVLYEGLGPTGSNVLVGVLSAVIDNVPVMFAVLQMAPDMSHGQWLLVTLTAGIGGSLLSVGSAAGVALMGQARGIYTFAAHLRWTWAIALGYAAGIGAHLLLNRAML